MNLASVIKSESELLLPTYDRQKVLFTRGKDVYLWDSKGKKYLDFLSGLSGLEALHTSGVLSDDFWLRSALSKNFCGPA